LLAAAAVNFKKMILEIQNLFGEKKQEQYKPERESLQKELSLIFNNDLTLQKLVNFITNDFSETLEYHQLCFGLSSCQKTSLLFNPHRLDTKAGKSKLSCFEALKDYNFLNGLSRMILHERKQKGDNYKSRYGELLYQILAFNINGVQYVNEIHPLISRNLALKYCNGLNSKVLDPCAGWGGRMLGFSTVCAKYYGYEPYTDTYNGLNNLGSWIKKRNENFDFKIENLPFEDAVIEHNDFDFAFTSPPYYDTEKYGNEKTNSYNRYKSFNDWCDLFYLPMIQKTMDSLKKDCSFVLNIGSRIYPLNEVLKSNFSNKYLIEKEKDMLQGKKSGLKNNENEGETFYRIVK
jgi:hypothetical protein